MYIYTCVCVGGLESFEKQNGLNALEHKQNQYKYYNINATKVLRWN